MIYRWIHFGTRNDADQSFRVNHILCSVTLFRKSCPSGDNVEKPDRPEITVWRMSVACWIAKAADTSSEYVIQLFPRQQWFPELATMLRLHVHCPSCYHHHRCFYYVISKLIIIISIFYYYCILPGYCLTSAEFDFWRKQALFCFLYLLNRLWGRTPSQIFSGK
jgi:hypothetical protein